MEAYKLDRIEDGIATIETPNGTMLRFSEKLFPENSKSGDCFILKNGVFIYLKEVTEVRKDEIFSLLSELK